MRIKQMCSVSTCFNSTDCYQSYQRKTIKVKSLEITQAVWL